MQYSEVENRDDYYQFAGRGVTVWDQAGKMVVYDRAEQKMAILESELFIVASYYIQRCALKKLKVIKVVAMWYLRLCCGFIRLSIFYEEQ